VRSVEFHPEASREVLHAVDYYAERDAVVASAFSRELAAAVDRVEEAPERWPSYLHGTRRA
jgi:plasmid stabilization system protein ParE